MTEITALCSGEQLVHCAKSFGGSIFEALLRKGTESELKCGKRLRNLFTFGLRDKSERKIKRFAVSRS